MQGNFSFHNPTRLHFGKESLAKLSEELQNYGPKVMLTYGGGSIKKNGIYDQVVAILKAAGKTIIEEPGVMPNPTIEKVHEGAKLAKEEKVDLILAVKLLLFIVFAVKAGGKAAGAVAPAEICVQKPVFLAFEVFDLLFPVHHHAGGHRLDTAGT